MHYLYETNNLISQNVLIRATWILKIKNIVRKEKNDYMYTSLQNLEQNNIHW